MCRNAKITLEINDLNAGSGFFTRLRSRFSVQVLARASLRALPCNRPRFRAVYL